MLIPIVLCIIFSLILRLITIKSKSYKFRPRYKKYSLAFICEWLFTLTIFSTYNIMISLVVNFESLGISDPISLSVSLVVSLIPIAAVILYFKFS